MKVSQATINFYLKTAKKLSDGSHPIMLRVCYHGFKDVSTHYSCPLKYWDKKNQQCKKGLANYAAVNSELNKLKAKVTAKRDEFIRLGTEYTPKMLLCEDNAKKGVSNVVSELIDSYYTEKELRGSTKTSWIYSRHMINEFHIGVIITEIDEGWCKRYSRFLKQRGLSDGTIRTRLGHIACIYRYASDKGLCDMGKYPYRDWKYTHKFKLSEKLLYIDKKCVDVMKEYFLNKTIKINGNRFTYIDDGYVDYKNRLFVLYFWLLGYYMQGMSPIDICLLKKKDFVVKRINNEEYYCIDTSRKKTGISVKIRLKVHTVYSQVMIGKMLMTDGEWFLPILKGLGDKLNERKYKNRIKSIFSYYLYPKIKDLWKELNGMIVEKNMNEGLNIPLIDEGCSFYSYRHSFAQMYINNPNASPLALATLMGRSVNTLSTYIQQLKEEEDLVEAVNIIN